MQSLLSNKFVLSIFILILGVAYGAYSLYGFTESEAVGFASEITQMETELKNLKDEIQKVKTFADNIPAVKQAFREQSLQLEAVLDSIPRTLELAGLLRKINVLAQNSAIEIDSFRPSLNETNQGFFKSADIDLKIRGSFVSTLSFLDQISKLKRVVVFEEMLMNLDGAAKGRSTQGEMLVTNLKLKTYRLGDS